MIAISSFRVAKFDLFVKILFCGSSVDPLSLDLWK